MYIRTEWDFFFDFDFFILSKSRLEGHGMS